MSLMEDLVRRHQMQEDEEEDAVSEVAQTVTDDVEEDVDDELREAELRLSKAAYYKEIVKNGVIQEDGSREASEVNTEVKQWARKSMVRLLKGVPEEQPVAPVQLPFTEKQIAALVAVANKVLATQGGKPAPPEVKTIQTTPIAPATPAVKSIKTTATPPPKKTPPKNPPPAPAAPPPKRQATPKAQDQKRERIIRVKRETDGSVDYDAIPSDTVFKDLDNQLYKFVPHPNEDNTRVKRKVSGQVKAGVGVPMPSPQDMEIISQTQAMAALNTGVSASNSADPMKQREPGVISGTEMHFIAAAAGSLNKE